MQQRRNLGNLTMETELLGKYRMNRLFRFAVVAGALFVPAAASAGSTETLDSLFKGCETQEGAACAEAFWSYVDVTGDGRLTVAEFTRFFREFADWGVVKSAEPAAAEGEGQAAGSPANESDRFAAVALAFLAGPIAARLVVSNFDYDGNGTVEREEAFTDMDETAFVEMVKVETKRLPTHAMALFGRAMEAQDVIGLGGGTGKP